MQRLITITVTLSLAAIGAAADDDLQREMQNDIVLRALVDELTRGYDGLELEDLERPYFIEYVLDDMCSAGASAELGAVLRRGTYRSRSVGTTVRVGSYDLDNTNFGGGFGRFGRFRGMRGRGFGGAIPVDDDYNAIRQAIWWSTDREYKNVVETFVQKKAFMENKLIEDKPPDFARAEPVVHFEDRADLFVDSAMIEEWASVISAVFSDYPEIQDSSVQVSVSTGNRYLVNTEGTRLRQTSTSISISANVEVLADDGMGLSDWLSIEGRTWDDIPPRDEVIARCRAMIEGVLKLRVAPLLDETYTGPVLFDAEAAASLFGDAFSYNFAGGQRPVGSGTSPDDFCNKLGRRILPRFMDVIDDPTIERFGERPVLGHYRYDEQAVPAERVCLVEKGRLQNLLMSRNPSKECGRSNGHGRGYGGAAIGCLIVSIDEPLTADELRKELIEAAQDEGLEYAVRVAGSRRGSPVVYKVFPDGREELVRGAELSRLDLKDFKRMLAAGDTPHVANSGGYGGGQTVITPAMLFEEVDLTKVDRDFDKPPILTAPVARDRG